MAPGRRVELSTLGADQRLRGRGDGRWIIIPNNLWEYPSEHRPPAQSALYNAATIVTLTVGVACMYIVLFGLLLLGAVAAISGDYLQTALGHPVGIVNTSFLRGLPVPWAHWREPWGSGLESERAVRRAIYSTRAQQRRTRQPGEAVETAQT